MKHKLFEGNPIRILYNESYDTLVFHSQDVSEAVGYSSIRSLEHHIVAASMIPNSDGLYISLGQLLWLKTRAYKTKKFKTLAQWAQKLDKDDFNPNRVYGLQEASKIIHVTIEELIEHLLSKSYADRYASNNNIRWNRSFKDKGYGTVAKIEDALGTRTSNVPKLTQRGLDLIVTEFAAIRSQGVLAFVDSYRGTPIQPVFEADIFKVDGQLIVNNMSNLTITYINDIDQRIAAKMAELTALFAEKAKGT